MKQYEFGAALSRLAYLSQMVADTDIEGIAEGLEYADTIAPLFGAPDEREQRIRKLRDFANKALQFKRDAIEFHKELSEADRIVSRQRLAALPQRASSATAEPSDPATGR